MIPRPRYKNLIEKLALGYQKMAFITGPRQAGKTTLGQQLGAVYYRQF